MNKYEFYDILNNKFNISDNETHKLFDIYKDFLQTQNKLFNLTRLDSEELIYEKYFLQAIIPFIGMDLNNLLVLDIGSGSGNPGIILKIIFPSMKLTIIESNKKRVNFMKELANKLGFIDIEFYLTRAEDANKNLYNKFDVVTSRAVSNLGALIEISCQFVKHNGLIIEPKSNKYEDEFNLVKFKLDDYGVKLEKIFKYDNSNVILFFKKNKIPNSIYPREWKQILKDYKG